MKGGPRLSRRSAPGKAVFVFHEPFVAHQQINVEKINRRKGTQDTQYEGRGSTTVR